MSSLRHSHFHSGLSGRYFIAFIGHEMTPHQFCGLVAALPGTIRLSYGAGHVIGSGTEVQDTHLLVHTGALGVRVMTGQAGERRIIAILGPGACVGGRQGVEAYIGNEWSLVALLPTTVLALPMAVYLQHVARDGRLAAAAASAKAQQHSSLLCQLGVFTLRDPLRRVAGVLLFLVDHCKATCPIAMGSPFRITQQPLAALCGLSRQTTNRQLLRLRGARILHVERGLVCVLDRAGLQAVVAGKVRPRARPPVTRCRLLHPATLLTCAPPPGPGAAGDPSLQP